MNCAHAFFFAEASLAFVSGLRAHSSNLLEYPAILDRVILVQYKMVVLTIVTQKNGETIFFDEPIPHVHFMKLISCSLYNAWDTLKNEGTFSILQPDKSFSVSKISPGHYTLEAMAKQLEESFKKYTYEISAETYSLFGQLFITNHGKRPLIGPVQTPYFT